MKPERPECIFVIQNKLGGVAYLNKNVINSAAIKDKFYVKVVLVDEVNSVYTRFTDNIYADEIIHFEYRSFENKYHILKRLHKIFGNSPGAIICNDGLEMEAIHIFGTNKTVYQLVHDFYNLKLSISYGGIVDVFIAHSELFYNVMCSANPGEDFCFYLRHGVSISQYQKPVPAEALRIIFVGRLVESKGVLDLYEINKFLTKWNVPVEWTIIGGGPLKEALLSQWSNETNFKFLSPETNEEVLSILSRQEIFVLPTRFEGSPVSVLEALSVGAVPVVTDLPGGIREIITENIGKRIPAGRVDLFAAAIRELHAERDSLRQLSVNCRELAMEKFDIKNTSNNYFELFGRYKELKKPARDLPRLKIGSRMDKKWLPNGLVSFIRKKQGNE